MRIDSVPFVLASAVFLGSVTATAQQPTDPRTPAVPDVILLPLQSLANDTVYHRQPTNSGDQPKGGPAAFVPFAKIRDARFAPDGRLVALLVEPAKDTMGEPPARRELPAKQVQWDGVAKRWITTDANLKFPELADPTKQAATPAGEVTQPRADRTLLASEIAQATVSSDPAAGASPPLTKDGKPAPEAPASVFWLAPSTQTLALAVIDNDGRKVPVPWSLLKVADDRGKVAFKIGVDAARLREAPVGDATNDQPPAELRHRIYKHFGIAAPAWDSPPPAEPVKPPTKSEEKIER